MSDIDREAALEELRQAFPPGPLDPQRAFAEWGQTYVGAEAFEQGVHGRRWTELAAKFLEYHHDALPFFGPSSIADYLPAYLAALLHGDPVLDGLPEFLLGILTRTDPERFDARFAQLTPAQRQAVRHTLHAVETAWAEQPRARLVREALDSYWDTNGEA